MQGLPKRRSPAKKVRSLAVTPEPPVSESAIRLSNRYDVPESEEPVMQPMSVEKREFQPRRHRSHVSRQRARERSLTSRRKGERSPCHHAD